MSATGGSAVIDERDVQKVVDEMFLRTDEKDWAGLRALYADGDIQVDMTSLVGGSPLRMTADDFVGGFRQGLHAGKVSHHMATNYRITFAGDRADVWAHGYAWNRVAALGADAELWETWGTYRLALMRAPSGWRIDGFTYKSKMTRGDDRVRTHQP